MSVSVQCSLPKAVVRIDGMVFLQYFGCGQFYPSAEDYSKHDVFQTAVRDNMLFGFCMDCGQKMNTLVRQLRKKINLPEWSSCSTISFFFFLNAWNFITNFYKLTISSKPFSI